jgi:gamma-glutamylcyclotransferase (GGCT)/AIG2-like uncharacterized protein YtfP
MADYLFVYGTLKPELAPPEIAVPMRQLRRVGSAVVRGFLYDLGQYPGLRLNADGDQVEGDIFELSNPAVLRGLDAYEGYDPRSPGESLFIRKQCQVRLRDRDERFLCWVYEYNREPAASQRIHAWPNPRAEN